MLGGSLPARTIAQSHTLRQAATLLTRQGAPAPAPLPQQAADCRTQHPAIPARCRDLTLSPKHGIGRVRNGARNALPLVTSCLRCIRHHQVCVTCYKEHLPSIPADNRAGAAAAAQQAWHPMTRPQPPLARSTVRKTPCLIVWFRPLCLAEIYEDGPEVRAVVDKALFRYREPQWRAHPRGRPARP